MKMKQKLEEVTAVLLVILGIIFCIYFSGCATTKIDANAVDKYIIAHSDMISTGISALSKFAITLSQKDPVEREVLKQDINQIVEKVARALDIASSTAEGTITPDQLISDLKVRDANTQAFIDAVTSVYQEGYSKMAESGRVKDTLPWARLILSSFKTLADGLNKATS